MSSANRYESAISVAVHRFNAPYNAAQTAWGRDEIQTVSTTTSFQPEIQVHRRYTLTYPHMLISAKGNKAVIVMVVTQRCFLFTYAGVFSSKQIWSL